MNSGTRILVIDDEKAVRRMLKLSLEPNGYIVFEAATGSDAKTQAIASRPEIIILDLGLPDMNGLQVLKEIREWSKVPVIVLTVSDAESDKVALLDAGADDYLTKPFNLPELLARLRVARRHSQRGQEAPVVKMGSLEIDLEGHTVKRQGEIVKLTATEFDLLRILVSNAGKVVLQRQLLREIWGPNSVEHTHYLRVYIGQLRHKLEEDPSHPRLIITEPGVGYRLSI